MIIVQRGWVGTADLLPDGTRQMGVYERNQYWVSTPGIAHNIFSPPGSVTHCVKYGDDVVNPEKKSDWWPAPEDFDAWTKSFLTEADLFRKVGLNVDKIRALTA